MAFNYGISVWTRDESGNLVSLRITSAAVLHSFREAGIQAPRHLSHVVTNGIAYSNEDFDALSSALAILRTHGITDHQVWHSVNQEVK